MHFFIYRVKLPWWVLLIAAMGSGPMLVGALHYGVGYPNPVCQHHSKTDEAEPDLKGSLSIKQNSAQPQELTYDARSSERPEPCYLGHKFCPGHSVTVSQSAAKPIAAPAAAPSSAFNSTTRASV